jgi:hypothetical protein
MLGFKKIRQLPNIIPTTGYMVPVATPESAEDEETFHANIGEIIQTTNIRDLGSNFYRIQSRVPAFKFTGDEQSGTLHLEDKGVGTATLRSESIDIQLDIVDVIPQTNSSNCIIICPLHGFMSGDYIKINFVDSTVNNRWEIEVIDTDSFYLNRTAGRGNHQAIYSGGGVAQKQGGYRLDLYQDHRHDPNIPDQGFTVALPHTREVYYNDIPVTKLYINTLEKWDRLKVAGNW